MSEKILNTKRLIIRKTSIDDVDLLLKMDKQEITQLYLGGLKNKTRDERILFLEKKILKTKNDKLGALTVCLLDETPIGFIEFNVKTKDCVAEISYIFDCDYCNKGYCTEACEKLIDIGFDELKLRKILANTVEGNEGSKRVLSKLGFVFKGCRNNFLDYELIKKNKDFIGDKKI